MENQTKAPPQVRAVADFLRSSKAGIKLRVGVMNGKRLDYFKGKGAIKALMSPAYQKLKNVPKVTTEQEASNVLLSLIPFTFILRIERGQASGGSSSSTRHVQISQTQLIKPEDYYGWFYEGSQWTTYIGGIAMVAIMLAAVMFPLWPSTLRLGVWYLSIGVLGLIGLFFAIAIVRLIFYIITVIVTPPGIWIFPKLFADVGVIESFIPFWEWDLPKQKKKKRDGEGKGKSKEKASLQTSSTNGESAQIEEVVDTSEGSRPQSRAAKVEDAQEEDES